MSAPTPLLLAGNMCDARLWTAMLAAITPAIVAEAIVFDRETTITAMAERVLARRGPLVPIGFSMGAIVALEVARLAPGRLAGIGLLDCNPWADLPERTVHRPRQQADVRAGRLKAVVADELKPNYLAAANRRNRALLDLTMDMALGLGPQVFVQQSEALRTRADLTPVLPTIRCPAFVATGAEDRLCPPEWHRFTAAEIGGRAALHVFPGAGHLLPLEQPKALAAALGPWLHDTMREAA